MKPLLGITAPDPVGQMLGTGYMRFQTADGVDGLVKESQDGNRLYILAVAVSNPGHGRFREFINQCKADYQTVCVWEIWNPWLESVLIRYGFATEIELQGDGEVLTGVRWDKH